MVVADPVGTGQGRNRHGVEVVADSRSPADIPATPPSPQPQPAGPQPQPQPPAPPPKATCKLASAKAVTHGRFAPSTTEAGEATPPWMSPSPPRRGKAAASRGGASHPRDTRRGSH